MERRFYEEYARIQDDHWWFVGRRRIIFAVLDAALGDATAADRRILDVGCGTGTNLSLLRRLGEVEGVDSEPEAVDFCRRRGETLVRLAPENRLPFAGGSFDVVTLLDVLEHVDDDRALLVEARRVLAPGGLVLITVPAHPWMWGAQDLIAHHKRRYTRRGLRDLLVRADLDAERSSYFNSILFPPVAAIRLVRRLRPVNGAVRSDFELNRPGPVNSLLARLFGLEALMLRGFDLPFGVSLLGLAVRSDDQWGLLRPASERPRRVSQRRSRLRSAMEALGETGRHRRC